MDKKVKNILSYAFWGAVAVVLVYFCLKSVDWGQFWQALETCRWEYIILSMFLGALVFYIRGCRWRMLLLPIDPSTSRLTCFNSYNICMAVNLALPRAGEVVKLGYVVKHSSKDAEGKRLLTFDKALGTLLTERVWDAVTAIGLAAVVLFAGWETFGKAFSGNYSLSAVGSGVWWALGGVIVLLAGFLALSWALRNKGGVWGKAWGFIRGIWDGLGTFLHMKNAWLFILHTIVIWVFYWLMTACVVWALRDVEAFRSLTMADAFFIAVIGSISSVVPVPGGFGAYHGVVAGALLSIWNIPIGTGMIFATLAHESQAITQGLCGLASYLHENFFRK